MSQRKKRPRTIEDSDDEDYSTPTQQRSRRSHESFIGRRRSRDQPSTSTDIAFDRPSSSLHSPEIVDQARSVLRGLDDVDEATPSTSLPTTSSSNLESGNQGRPQQLPIHFNEENLTPHQRRIRQQNAQHAKRIQSQLTNVSSEPSTSSVPPESASIEHQSTAVGNPEPLTSVSPASRSDSKTSRRRSKKRIKNKDNSDDSDDDDEDYLPSRARPPRPRSDYPRRTTRIDQRQRALQAALTSDSDAEDSIGNPVILMGSDVCRLGDENGLFDIRCPYCGALDFKTIFKTDKHRRDIPSFVDQRDFICCDGGKVFIPPMKRRPAAIEELSERRVTKMMLNSYNTCFSFASLQYNKIPAAPFGLPVAKTLGPIRHFPSAALPNDPNRPRFGNYYLYMGDEAAQLRMEGFSHLDPEIVLKIQKVMEQCHPFANTLRTMGSIINEVQRSGEDEDLVRLRIVDARMVPKEWLQGHPGLYRDPIQCGESVALFYNATIEQDVMPPGLMIYPRKGNKLPLPIFPWDPRINTFCYPLLYPYGEYGHKYGGFKLAEDPTVPYERRLVDWAQKNPAIAADWDLNHTVNELTEYCHKDPFHLRFRASGDPNIEIISDLSDGNEDDNVYDHILHDLENLGSNENGERREFVERGGEIYPRQAYDDETENEGDTMVDFEGDQMIRNIVRPSTVSSGNQQRIDPNGEPEGDDLSPEQQMMEFVNALEKDEPPIEPASAVNQTGSDDERSIDGNSEHSDGVLDENADITDLPEERQLELDPSEVQEVQHRKFATLRQYGLYIHQQRKTLASDKTCANNRFTSSGKLGQVHTLDLATRMYQSRHSFQRKHNTEYMSSTKTKFLKALQTRADRHQRTIGCVCTVPHTVAGSPRHLQNLYEHTVAMSRTRNGRPDLFITSTTNVNWPEIQNNLLPGETWNDRPDLVNKSFKKRYEKFLDMVVGKRIEKGRAVRKKGLFGRVRWYSYSIEFQQRGPPHAHLIVSLKDHIKTAEQIDRVCQANLPKRDGTPEIDELRQLVEDFMIHRPCEGDAEAYCRQGTCADKTQCRKHFPKPYSDTTKFGDSNYPELRRPNDGEHCTGNQEADNRYVVPYNAQLLSFFRAHVNVEVVSNLSVVKYIFKYVFKGYDRVLVEAITSMSAPDTAAMSMEGHLIYPKSIVIPPGARKQRELEARKMLKDNGIDLVDKNGKPVLVYDEYAMVEDQRALTGCEAMWDFQSFPRHGQSHTVVDLFVHGEDHEPIFYKKEDQETKERELLHDSEIQTRFKDWFKLNQRDEDARSLTYEELPTKYLFQNHQWRKKEHIKTFLFGRIKSVHPRNKETFAIRLLATVQKGPQSFEELRTVNGVVQPTFVAAAMELGLMNSQIEWDKCLDEASTLRIPLTMRRLFASILVFNFVKDPVSLWEKYKVHFYERKLFWTDQQKEAHALHHINSFLNAHLTSLEEFHLPAIQQGHLPRQEDLIDDSGMLNLSPLDAKKEYEKFVKMLNEQQNEIFYKIVAAVGNPDHLQPFFIQGSGGTGKTLLMKTIFYALISKGHKVASVAHTGVAARLLPYGSTAHRQFHIPLAVEEDMRCKVELETTEADVLRQISVVFWDEATMSDRRILQAVDNLMKDLHPENDALLFGGVKFIFGGDWKQTLPVVPETRGAAVVNYTMRGSELWKKMEVLHLTHNMRARFDKPFATWLTRVGLGIDNIDRNSNEVREEDQMVKLEFGTIVNTEQELMTAVFGDLSSAPDVNRNRFESSAILAVDNKTTFDVNEKALKRMPGEIRTFLSIDEHHEGTEFTYLDPEIYHGETPSGFPPHELNVKVGSPVILLLNINTALGLVNGTRMIIDEIQEHIIWAIPLQRTKRTPERWPLTRMHFSPVRVFRVERCFQRTQFPIRLAFSMTINKSQGQTLDRVGILLRTPCFSHGQLYVALSRVRRSSDLFIYNYHGMYDNLMDKKYEMEIIAEEKRTRMEEKKRQQKNKKARELRQAKRKHRALPKQEEDSSPEEEDDVVFYGPNRDKRQFTNNVVYASAISN